MQTVETFYEVRYGSKITRFNSRTDAEDYARKQAVLPFVQRLRNGNGSMDLLCELFLNARDEVDVAIAGIDDHIKQYQEVK